MVTIEHGAGGPEATERRTTMAEVAAAAGVSPKTVSRVVNGERYVSPEVARRVHDAIARLEYYPDPYAGRLRRKTVRDPLIGLLVSSVSNPFSAAVHRAVEDVAHERHAVVLATSSDDDEDREHANVETFLRRRVDALILAVTGHNVAQLSLARGRGTKLVFVDRRPDGIDADSVTSDNVQGGRMAAEHLIRHGHRRLAFLGDRPVISTALERRTGFLDEARRHGIAQRDVVAITGLHTERDAYSCLHSILDATPRPSAVFASQNLIGIGSIRALHEMGLQNETALIAFDDIPFSDILVPGVTTVEQDPRAIGTIAARQALARIGGDDSPIQRRILPPHLIPRGSGEIPASS